MGGGDEIVMVNNTYKSALRSARASCLGPAADLETALAAAERAVRDGAWGGPRGEDFAGELNRYRRQLNEAGPQAVADLDTAIAGQPDRVESTAWQVSWHRMGPR